MHTKSKISKDSGLTINQSKVIKGENYIVVNRDAAAANIEIILDARPPASA